MAFQISDLKKVASLARMSLEQNELMELANDLNRVVEYIELLSEVDVTKVEPMFHTSHSVLSLREDVSKQVLGKDCLKDSEGYEDGLISVPRIIE